MKKRLCISFSGGETSAFMMQWILKNKMNEWDEIIVIFANTGDENEETLIFVDKCSNYFNIPVIWVECVTNQIYKKGVTAKVVDFNTASRKAEPFIEMVKKHGIPNISFSHCSRELKKYTIKSYLRSIKWKEYYTAIGIRADEIDRISKDYEREKLYYPLCLKECETTKKDINAFWQNMPFRLNLKGYQGNCKVCWKKSLRKLLTIAKETPEAFNNFANIEKKFENYIPKSQEKRRKTPIRFFRGNLSCEQIFEMSKDFNNYAMDDSVNKITYEQLSFDLDISNGCVESCEVF